MEKEYIKVSALNNYIKLLLDDNSFLHKVYLKGEISNFKHHMSGHLYFTLKDEESRINAIMFRNKTMDLKFTPEDGKKVLVEGRISCYPAQGTYQIYVEKMEEDGLGNLYVLYEELKRNLAKEGLFSLEHKKAIPKYPSSIGIVTAPTGAAIRDILSTIKRRFPVCKTILFPALVQGKGAALDIARQIKRAQDYDIDVLIIGRGGGSIEDLWAFNEEVVARAIYASKIPIISAVGHEIDYTISDYVADLRAPTPTGAAEMAVPTVLEVEKQLQHLSLQLNQHITRKLQFLEQTLEQFKKSYILKNPGMLYDIKYQKLDYCVEQLNSAWKQYFDKKNNCFQQLISSYALKNPLNFYQGYIDKIEFLKNRSIQAIHQNINLKDHQLEMMINTLKLANPLNILDKGYSLVRKEDKIIKSSKDLKENDIVSIRMKKGSVLASIKEVH